MWRGNKMKKLFWIVGIICGLIVAYMGFEVLWKIDKLLAVAITFTQVLYYIDTLRSEVLK